MKKVLLLLANGFETFEACVFMDVIGWNQTEGDKSTILYTCGLQKEIKSSFNHRFIVDYLVDDIDVGSFDALAIPGGFEIFGFYNDAYNDKFLGLINKFKTSNRVIASICVGALHVAKSGILKSKNATTYNSPKRRDALRDFGVNVLNQPIVMDDNIITSWNPSTAADVAFLLLEHLTNKENTNYVRQLMGFEEKS